MKKALIMLVLLVLVLTGCGRAGNTPDTPAFATQDTQATEPASLPFSARYIRTNGCDAELLYPQVFVIESAQALRDYYDEQAERYDLERKEKVYGDTTIGFLDACDSYGEDYFETNYLILVLLQEGSGSISHKAETVDRIGRTVQITIHRDIPEVCTDDMAQWHVILELGREAAVPGEGDIRVYVDEWLGWDGGPVHPVPTEAEFKTPPVCMARTAAGDGILTLAGYQWNYENPDGTCTSVIADQPAKPLPLSSLTPMEMNADDLERVYLPVEGESYYAPADYRGYLVKLNWEKTPSSVTCTRFHGTKPEQIPFDLEGPFYADMNADVYEFTATWDNNGSGYWGEATYYLYIVTVFTCS